MDPLTLFALANGAVAAVKKGCQLYKDIKSAAGDIKGVIKDLDETFHKKYPNPTANQVKQLNEEKARVKDLNKKSEDTTNIYAEIGDYLGQYYDNFYKCMAVFEEEEKRAETEVYTGEASLGKRALQRVLMRKQLQQMEVELRELMVYQSPPELGALYTEVEAMMKEMGKRQKILIQKKLKEEEARLLRRKQRMAKYRFEIVFGVCVLIIIIIIAGMMMWIADDAQKRWGDYLNRPNNYREQLREKKEQEWFEREKNRKEYRQWLEDKKQREQNESKN